MLCSVDAVAAVRQVAGRMKTVVILGDSITAGLGVSVGASLPVQLQAALRQSGVPVRVVGAGVSGDTSADGLARLDFSVPTDIDLCVVELGGNDLLQGVSAAVTGRNLTQIIRRLRARGINVLLTGVRVPAPVGRAYARDFDTMFRDVAKREDVMVLPDLMEGVTEQPSLKQADGLHPNARGVLVIAARLAPVVARALTQQGGRR
ncbi:MAG: arylesterase [Caulobacteraceae bacterium]